MIDYAELRRAFAELYGAVPRLFRAPGRVNLIGEHTDYNEGYVLPFAIDRETAVAAAPRTDRRVCVRSREMSRDASFDLDAPFQAGGERWPAYVAGVAHLLEARGVRLGGANLLIYSEVPPGAGLASSAALEVAVALAFLGLAGETLEAVEVARICQRAERDFAGANCGLMDQLTALKAQPGRAMLLNCRSLDTDYFPLDSSKLSIVVCDSGVRHELAASEFNRRREECAAGVRLLQAAGVPLRTLSDLQPGDLKHCESRLPPLLFRRCRHVVSENARTLAAANALQDGDLAQAGALLYESHCSLRDDYEVSCAELDMLVALARPRSFVHGARMCGGGFGGCTINLLRPGSENEFIAAIGDGFQAGTGRKPSFYIVKPSAPAREI
jgi:galactokinase